MACWSALLGADQRGRGVERATRPERGGRVVYVEVMDPHTEALEMRVGVRSTRELPRVAANAVAGGNSSSALRELAGLVGLPVDERAAAIGRLSRDALRALGVLDLAREEAAERLVRRYAGQIVDGSLVPVDGAARIVAAGVEMGWDGEGQALWDEGTRDIYQLAEMHFNGRQSPGRKRIQMIEDAIVDAARRLLQA